MKLDHKAGRLDLLEGSVDIKHISISFLFPSDLRPSRHSNHQLGVYLKSKKIIKHFKVSLRKEGVSLSIYGPKASNGDYDGTRF